MRIALAIVFFAAACFMLYYGSTMLLLVPGVPGGMYWTRERALYGLFPAGSGLGLLGLAAWVSISSRPTAVALLRRIYILFVLAVACIIAFWAVVVLRARS